MSAVSMMRAPAAILLAGLVPNVSRSLSRIVMGLLFAQLWFAQSTLGAAQVGVELLLGITLLVLLRQCRLQKREIALLLIFGVSVGASLVVNSLLVTAQFAKVFGLSILSLLVFSRYRFDTADAVWVIALNVLLTIYQYAFGNPDWFLAIVLTFGKTWREFAGSRPLGLFMSTHVSAVLSALLFLWLGRSRIFAIAGLLGLVVSGSTNVLLAYTGQLAHRVLGWLRIEKFAIGLAMAAALLLLVYADTVLNLDLTALSGFVTGREQASYSIIIGQLFSPDYYLRALTLIPGDPALMYNDATGDWANEIGYFSALQQGGFILGVGYLVLLFSRIGGYRLFVAIAMLHFSMATIPIFVFLLLQWSDALSARRSTSETLVFVTPREA